MSPETLRLELAGTWIRAAQRPDCSLVFADICRRRGTRRSLVFHSLALRDWDSTLLAFLLRLEALCADAGIGVSGEGLPDGARQLLRLAASTTGSPPARQPARRSVALRLGASVLRYYAHVHDVMVFLGEVVLALSRLLVGRARLRPRDLLQVMIDAGPRALPIVTLIAFLMGLILAFVGAMQLRMFGAEIYVADLVGIGIVREMGAIMTGVVMAGRTGAAFAAQLGTMQVNEEIDALTTCGIAPMDFLVLPRLLGLVLVMPLLCLYANLMGILGGMLVGIFMLDLGFWEYYTETVGAVTLNDLFIGVFMSAVFGVLVAGCGCLRGLQSGRSAADVGSAATSAMVSSIVSIVLATALITVICDVLGV